MSASSDQVTGQAPRRSWLRRWRGNESGATAIEFAMIAAPFLMLLFGIMAVSIYFFTSFSLENAAWSAGRAIRTGDLQQSIGAYAGKVTMEDRKRAFKAELCARAPTVIDCDSKVVIIVQSNNAFGGITRPQCASNGVMMNPATAGFDTGGSSAVVLITVCYPWAFGNAFPFIQLGNLADGSTLMQTSVAFRTEPYQ